MHDSSCSDTSLKIQYKHRCSEGTAVSFPSVSAIEAKKSLISYHWSLGVSKRKGLCGR